MAAIIADRAFALAETIDANPADILARLHGVPLQNCAAVLAAIERVGHTGIYGR